MKIFDAVLGFILGGVIIGLVFILLMASFEEEMFDYGWKCHNASIEMTTPQDTILFMRNNMKYDLCYKRIIGTE